MCMYLLYIYIYCVVFLFNEIISIVIWSSWCALICECARLWKIWRETGATASPHWNACRKALQNLGSYPYRNPAGWPASAKKLVLEYQDAAAATADWWQLLTSGTLLVADHPRWPLEFAAHACIEAWWWKMYSWQQKSLERGGKEASDFLNVFSFLCPLSACCVGLEYIYIHTYTYRIHQSILLHVISVCICIYVYLYSMYSDMI